VIAVTSPIDITRIVNTSILQTFPDAFYKATGLATGIHSLAGELITSIPRDNFCSFCKNMFFSPDGHKRCLQSNMIGDRIAFETSKPYIYHCHAGLIDVAAPLIVNETHVGSITCGQLILKTPDDHYRARVRKKLAAFPKKFQEKQLAALEEVPVLPLKRVQGLAQLLSVIANNIVSLIISNIKQKELNIENIKLINEIKASSLLEKEIKNAQIQLKEAELKALQAQINPHFLYNTLDSIQWLALMHGADDIRQMIVTLGKLLRYSLDLKQNIVSVRKELEQVENYLFIQKVRHGEKFSYQMNIEAEILEFHIPKLVLQPLVENAIQHGIEPKPCLGKIWINGWLKDREQAIIEIADDGVGMSEDSQAILADSLSKAGIKSEVKIEVNSHHRIGLENVNKRLIYHFGENSALEIKSRRDQGTVIRFRIPRNFRKEEMLYD
jgi:two-component system LytT family sensor kinase